MKSLMVIALSVIILAIAVIGCGTDVKPTTFTAILRDPSDINELSACLSEEPAIDDKTIKVTLDKQCLIGFSNQESIDPSLSPSYAEILVNPEVYMDKLLTFEAVVKKLHYNDDVELYTNNRDIRFFIRTHGASLYRLDEEGEEVPIEPNETYQFKCRIYEFKTHADWGRVWEVNAEFIISTSKKIIYPPEIVEQN